MAIAVAVGRALNCHGCAVAALAGAGKRKKGKEERENWRDASRHFFMNAPLKPGVWLMGNPESVCSGLREIEILAAS